MSNQDDNVDIAFYFSLAIVNLLILPGYDGGSVILWGNKDDGSNGGVDFSNSLEEYWRDHG